MLESLTNFFVRNYQPLNTIEISRRNLLENYKYLQSLGFEIAPVLKSNAYGHGICEVAGILEEVAAPFYCVDSLYEAYELMKIGVKTKILIMGYIDPKSLMTKKLPFSLTLYSHQQLKIIRRYQPQIPLHIFVDTGMHREGFALPELPALLQEIKKTGLNVEGIMSHFGEAENPHKTYTRAQIELFEKAKKLMQQNGIEPGFVHFANTSGTLHSQELKGLGNVCRAGLGLYGIDPEGKNAILKPALEFKTTIAQVKEIKKGECVGYNFTYKAKKDTKIAVLPVGYNDGVDLRLSNNGSVTIGGNVCPIVGRISMNITTIDVSHVKKVKVGDVVTMYSKKYQNPNSIISVSRKVKTIPYEILIHVNASTKRRIV